MRTFSAPCRRLGQVAAQSWSVDQPRPGRSLCSSGSEVPPASSSTSAAALDESVLTWDMTVPQTLRSPAAKARRCPRQVLPGRAEASHRPGKSRAAGSAPCKTRLVNEQHEHRSPRIPSEHSTFAAIRTTLSTANRARAQAMSRRRSASESPSGWRRPINEPADPRTRASVPGCDVGVGPRVQRLIHSTATERVLIATYESARSSDSSGRRNRE